MVEITARNDTNSPFTIYDVNGDAVTFAAMGGAGFGDFVTDQLAALQLFALVGGVVTGVPVNTEAPEITGTAQVGETLTASDGAWEGDPVPEFTYQWYADAVAIEDADADTYDPVADDIGSVITVVVTATNSAGVSTATSDPTAAVIDEA